MGYVCKRPHLAIHFKTLFTCVVLKKLASFTLFKFRAFPATYFKFVCLKLLLMWVYIFFFLKWQKLEIGRVKNVPQNAWTPKIKVYIKMSKLGNRTRVKTMSRIHQMPLQSKQILYKTQIVLIQTTNTKIWHRPTTHSALVNSNTYVTAYVGQTNKK
jgi:hypothetical protein